MSGLSGPLVVGKARLTFSTLEGVVLATDQRSDSITSGGGRTVVVDGSGGGTTSVDTTVIVSRDIWIRDFGGVEHHVRVAEDIPVRSGQDIAFIYCRGEVSTAGNRLHEAGGLMSVYVLATNKVYTVLSCPSLTSRLLEPPLHPLRLAGAFLLWIISVLLIAVFGIGFLLLAVLFTRAYLRSKRRRKQAEAITGELEAEHQKLLNGLNSARQTRLAARQTTEPARQLPETEG